VAGGIQPTVIHAKEWRLARTDASFAENPVLKADQSGDRNARSD
jgi:hypothetical protein